MAVSPLPETPAPTPMYIPEYISRGLKSSLVHPGCLTSSTPTPPWKKKEKEPHCKKAKKEDGHIGKMIQTRKRKYHRVERVGISSSIANFEEVETPSVGPTMSALMVVENVQNRKQSRKQFVVTNELSKIRKRVKRTLVDGGIELESESDHSSDDEQERQRKAKLRLPPIYNARAARAKHKEMQEERNEFRDMVTTFHNNTKTKAAIMKEINNWFNDNLEMDVNMLTAGDLEAIVINCRGMHSLISKCFRVFMDSNENVIDRGGKLLYEVSKIIAERKALLSKHAKKDKMPVYDNHQLSDPVLWNSAVKNLVTVYEDSQRVIKSINFKTALMLGQKQFEFMVLAAEKKTKELEEKMTQHCDMENRLDEVRRESDRFRRDLTEVRRKMTKVENELSDTNKGMEVMKQMESDASDKIIELNATVDHLRQKLGVSATAVGVTSETVDVSVEVGDGSLESEGGPSESGGRAKRRVVEGGVKVRSRVSKVGAEVVVAGGAGAGAIDGAMLKGSNTEVMNKIDAHIGEKIGQLESALEAAREEVEDLKTEMTRLQELTGAATNQSTEMLDRLDSVENAAKESGWGAVRRKVKKGAQRSPSSSPSLADNKDSQYYKTLMSGLKKDFNKELNQIRSHMKHEKMRFEASIKKMELCHKEQLGIINRDTMRLLRCITHMRDHLLLCIEREGLKDATAILNEFGALLKTPPDPKNILSSCVGTVTEYLRNMEDVLSKSFLAMRMMVKGKESMVGPDSDTGSARVVEAVAKKTKSLHKAGNVIGNMATTLKDTKESLHKHIQIPSEPDATDARFKGLLDRYNVMQKMFLNIRKEMEILHKDFHETIKTESHDTEAITCAQIGLDVKQGITHNANDLRIPVSYQRENIRLLFVADYRGHISIDVHLTIRTMINRSLEIIRECFVMFCQRYIAFKKFKKSSARVTQLLIKEKGLNADTREEMQNYLYELETKWANSMKEYFLKMKKLKEERKDLDREMYRAFNELFLDTRLLLLHPLLKDKNKRITFTKAVTTVTRPQMRMLLNKQRRTQFTPYMGIPDQLQGNAFPVLPQNLKIAQLYQHKFLRKSMSLSEKSSMKANMVTPHMLAYDINKPLITATRAHKTTTDGDDKETNWQHGSRLPLFNMKRTVEAFHLHRTPPTPVPAHIRQTTPSPAVPPVVPANSSILIPC